MAKKAIDLAQLVICPKCNSSNPSDARYCVNCGANLSGQATAKATAQTKKEGFFSRLFGGRKAA